MDGLEDGLAGEAELVLAAHRARPVEHEGEVDGRPATGGIGRHGRRDEVDEQEALGAAVGADEAPVGTDGELRGR